MTTSATEPQIPALTDKPVTSASEWRAPRHEGLVLELPSGKVARVRRAMDLGIMLKTGQIPNPLAGVVNEMIRSQSPDFPTDKMSNEAVAQMMSLVDLTCSKCFMEPRVEIPPTAAEDASPEEKAKAEAWQPTEGAISVEDLDQRDRFFIFGWAQGGPADLAPFRKAANPPVATRQDGAEVPDDTEPTGRAD